MRETCAESGLIGGQRPHGNADVSSKALIILAVIMVVVGGVWVFQGTGYLGGSFMTGQSQWTLIGAVTALIGATILLWAGFRR